MRKVIVALCLVLCWSSTAVATTWYVRPGGGSYGAEDGSSYADAINGIPNIPWGSMSPGDTVYICDTHVASLTSSTSFINRFCAETGGTSGNPLVIRGDYPDHPGIVWGVYKDERAGGIVPANWVDQEDGTFYNETTSGNRAYAAYGIWENVSGDTGVQYEKKEASASVVTATGPAYYLEFDEANNKHKVWVKPYNSSTFQDNIYFSGLGYGHELFILNDSEASSPDYITYRNLKFICTVVRPTNENIGGLVEGLSIIDCVIHNYGVSVYGNIIRPEYADNWLIQGCELAYGFNGWYTVDVGYGDITNISIIDNWFHDIGTNAYTNAPTSGSDGHGIGIQGNHDYIIRGNTFQRCGSAIDLYVAVGAYQYNFLIENNFISDMRADHGDVRPGDGIALEGNVNNPVGYTYNIQIFKNIIYNCEGYGLYSSRKGDGVGGTGVYIWNNIFYGNERNLSIYGGPSDCTAEGVSASVVNNIFMNPDTYHFHIVQTETCDPEAIDVLGYVREEHNIFYPAGAGDTLFYMLWIGSGESSGTVNYTTWKSRMQGAITAGVNWWAGGTIGSGSLTSDPAFLNSSGSYALDTDFQIGSLSPARDAGINVGLATDYAGDSIPRGAGFDIGAYEFLDSKTILNGITLFGVTIN